MHDPMTEAFRFKSLGITVWHVDPERGGDDDSCDWFGRHRPLAPREEEVAQAVWNMESLLDNRPHYPDSREHKEFQHLKAAVSKWRRRSKWRVPVRWHVWHWRIQWDFAQHLKRWLFSRCATCNKRFPWGYYPVSTQWHGGGPRWFRGEAHTYHHECPIPRALSGDKAAVNG